MTPVAGTTRYLCPLECGWHHDEPPPSMSDAAGITPDPAAGDLSEAIASIAGQAVRGRADETEEALSVHLGTHTTEQFVRTIQQLRAELEQARVAAAQPGPRSST